MEPIRFADILFVFLTLVITLTILWFVNKARSKSKLATEASQAKSNETVTSAKKDAEQQ